MAENGAVKTLAALLCALILVTGCMPQALRNDSIDTYDRAPNGSM